MKNNLPRRASQIFILNFKKALEVASLSWLNGNSQILVETHSEQLIFRVLRGVGGKLNHNDLSVNYVSNENSETVVKNIRVDERGRFLDVWPQGFFNERLSEF